MDFRRSLPENRIIETKMAKPSLASHAPMVKNEIESITFSWLIGARIKGARRAILKVKISRVSNDIRK